MLDINRPLHAYDADKIEKGIIVRNSKFGEEFTALDNKNYKLEKFQRNIVDLIDIDCEGFEESVIKSINFKKTIKCILLERPNYEVHKILKKNNKY